MGRAELWPGPGGSIKLGDKAFDKVDHKVVDKKAMVRDKLSDKACD